MRRRPAAVGPSGQDLHLQTQRQPFYNFFSDLFMKVCSDLLILRNQK